MSEHFNIKELTASSTATRLGIDNTPPDDVLGNIERLMDGLEQVRSLLGDKPMHIDSGYRCPALNKAVGGASNSAHMQGWAADFICPDFGTPKDIAIFLSSSSLRFDKLIQEGHWVHISFDPKMRGNCMTAHFDAAGNATYTPGVA